MLDSNQRPLACEASALTTEPIARNLLFSPYNKSRSPIVNFLFPACDPHPVRPDRRHNLTGFHPVVTGDGIQVLQ